jgi:polar amino acid transport system substrate-binding protein
MKRYAVIMVVLATVLPLLLSGCGQQQFTIQKGKLLVGTETDIPPYVSMEGGRLAGYSVELCEELAKRMGLECEIVDVPKDELFNALDSGKIDIIGKPTKITPERSEKYDVSIPYLENNNAVYVVQGSSIKSEADLSGKVVGVRAGTPSVEEVKKIEGVKEVRSYDTHELGLAALEKGEIDAYVGLDDMVSYHAKKKQGKIVMVCELGPAEWTGIYVKKGDAKLLEKVNEALEKMKEDGTLQKLEDKWLD